MIILKKRGRKPVYCANCAKERNIKKTLEARKIKKKPYKLKKLFD